MGVSGKSPTSPTLAPRWLFNPHSEGRLREDSVMSSNLRLIRRVQGQVGSLRLYDHSRLGLAEVVEVHEGTTQVIELRRHERKELPSLMSYADEVQRELADSDAKAARALKRVHSRRLAGMWRRRAAR